MSDTRSLKDKLKNATEVTSLSSTDRMAVIDSLGDLSKITTATLQRYVFDSQAINLDQPDRSGVFNIYRCSGTKPDAYGVVLSFGTYPGDIYQLALTHLHRFYVRSIVNKIQVNWILVGGGVIYLLPNNYANALKGGGLRDDWHKVPYQRPREASCYGCSSGKKDLCGRRLNDSIWRLQCQQLYSESSSWSVSVGASYGNDLSSPCLGSDLLSSQPLRDLHKSMLGWRCKHVDEIYRSGSNLAPERRAAA